MILDFLILGTTLDIAFGEFGFNALSFIFPLNRAEVKFKGHLPGATESLGLRSLPSAFYAIHTLELNFYSLHIIV